MWQLMHRFALPATAVSVAPGELCVRWQAEQFSACGGSDANADVGASQAMHAAMSTMDRRFITHLPTPGPQLFRPEVLLLCPCGRPV